MHSPIIYKENGQTSRKRSSILFGYSNTFTNQRVTENLLHVNRAEYILIQNIRIYDGIYFNVFNC